MLVSLREIANAALHPAATSETLANAINLSDADGQQERPNDSHNHSRDCLHSLPPGLETVFWIFGVYHKLRSMGPTGFRSTTNQINCAGSFYTPKNGTCLNPITPRQCYGLITYK